MGADLPALTREWLRGITGVGFVPGVRAHARAALQELLEELVAAVRAEPFDPAVGHRIGAELVDLRMSAPPVAGITVRLLAERLPGLAEGDPATVRERVPALLEHVVTGFVTAQRDAAVSAAEQMNRSEKIHWRRVQTDLQQRLQHALLHDPRTGLPNEQHLRHYLDEYRTAPRLGLCLLGVDRWPELADTLGHDSAGRLLIAVAHRLEQIGADFLAHLGEDQFVLVADPDDLVKLADQARRALRAVFAHDGHPLRIDVTAGLVESPRLHDARLALGWARHDRLEHAVFDAGRAEADRRRHRLAAALPAALEAGEFLAHYQPIHRLADRALVGVEALARWQLPAGGPLLPPADFITLAEHTGMIGPLGRYLLDQACHRGVAWRRAGRDLLISVNLSPLQLGEPTLVADVADILHRTGLPADRLQLEITESVALDQGYETLHRLADLGVRLAVDDFGTGWSSLSGLSRLPVTTVKLASELLADPEVVRHTIALCHALGLQVVAEGIETGAEERLLRELGCDLGQGFHFARPAPELPGGRGGGPAKPEDAPRGSEPRFS